MVRSVVFLIAILAATPVHAESGAIPATPAGRVLAAWLEAFNSGERARMDNYRQQYEPAAELTLDTVMSFRGRTGGFDLVGIRKSEPLYIEYLVKERASDLRAIGRFVLSSADPPKVETAGLRAIPTGSEVIGFEIDARRKTALGVLAAPKARSTTCLPWKT